MLQIKERKLEELNDAVKQITKEATEEIKRMSEQLEELQMKSKNNNNSIANIENDKFLSGNNMGMNNKNISELKNENLRLKIENNSLRKELNKKNNELQFWKNKKSNININTSSSALKEIEINQLKRTLYSYGNKIKLISEQYKNFVNKHEREKKSLLRQINNLKKIKNQNLINPNRFNNKLNKFNNFFTDVNNDINEYNYTDINKIENNNDNFNNNDEVDELSDAYQIDINKIRNNNNKNQYYGNENDIKNLNSPVDLNMENIDNLNQNINIDELNEINSPRNIDINELDMNNLEGNDNIDVNQDLNENEEVNDIKELNK